MNGIMFRTVHRGSAIGEEDAKLQQGRRCVCPGCKFRCDVAPRTE